MQARRKCQAWGLGLWAAALLFAATPGRAADPGDNPSRGETGQMQQRSAGTLNVSDAEIRSLRDKGYSWGDIGRALVISEESGKQLSDVTGLRDSGMEWPQIAERYNVQLMDGRSHGKKTQRGRQGMEQPRGGTRGGSPDMREAPSGGSDRGTTSPGVSPNTAPGSTQPGLPPSDGGRGAAPGNTPSSTPSGTPSSPGAPATP